MTKEIGNPGIMGKIRELISANMTSLAQDSPGNHVETVARLPDDEIERKNRQFQEDISALMKDLSFLIEIAVVCDSGYKAVETQKMIDDGKEPEAWMREPLLTDEQKALLLTPPPTVDINTLEAVLSNPASISDVEKETLIKTMKQRKQYDDAKEMLATNLSGFAALQECLDFVIIDTEDYYQTLDRIISGEITSLAKQQLCRIAHATWYNSQLWRGRYDRTVVKDFDLLPDDEKDKDWRQIVDSAITLKQHLQASKTASSTVVSRGD